MLNPSKLPRAAALFGLVALASIALLAWPDRAKTVRSSLDAEALQATRIPFIANRGQLGEQAVAFYASTFHGSVHVTQDGEIVYSLPAGKDQKATLLKESLIGAAVAVPRGAEPGSAKISYFLGADSKRWQGDIPSFERVTWGQVYPGIEMSLRAKGASAEKIFQVRPEADPTLIRIAMTGAQSLAVAASGELLVGTHNGPVRFSAPVAYQERDGAREPVAVRYRVEGREYGFVLGSYDRSRPLVIDPLLAATYLGSSANEDQYKLRMAVDPASGDVVVVGNSFGTDFPVTTARTASANVANSSDLFVARLSGDLTTLKAATYLGGNSWDAPVGVGIDGSGNIFVGGHTSSNDFPTTAGVIAPSYASINAGFVSKLSGDLQTLQASTFLHSTASASDCSGSSSVYASAMAVDSAGNVYLSGSTTAKFFLVPTGAYQSAISVTCSTPDAYVLRLNSGLTSVLGGTYFKGFSSVRDMAVDASNNVYLVGWTGVTTMPVTVTGSALGGLDDTYVAKLDANLTTLLAGRYIGGSGMDVPMASALDSAGNLYVVGYTASTVYAPTFPVTAGSWESAVPAGLPSELGYAVRLTPTLGLQAATYLHDTSPRGVALDNSVAGGAIVVSGKSSGNFPFPANAYDPKSDGFTPQRVFVGRLSADLSQLLGATNLRGQCDWCNVAIGAGGNVYVTGHAVTPSGRDTIDLSATAYDTTFNGVKDVFVAKLSPDLAGTSNLHASATTVNFGTVVVPVTSTAAYPTASVTFDNPGTAWLTIGSMSLAGTDASHFRIDSNTCTGDAASLRPAAMLPATANRSCTVGLSFRPYNTTTATLSAQLQVVSTDPAKPTTVISLIGSTSSATSGGGTPPPPTGGGTTGSTSTGGGGGCTIASSAATDPLLPALLLIALMHLARGRRSRRDARGSQA